MINSRLSTLIPQNSLLERGVPHIVAVCFLAPIFWANFWLGYTVFSYHLIGFLPDKVTYWSIVGCFTKTWMYPVTYFSNQIYFLTWVGTGFLLSRRGRHQNSFSWTLAGAFMLYPIVDRFIGWLTHFKTNPLWFLERKELFEKKALPMFGDFYTFKWVSFWIDNFMILLLMFVVYKVVLQYWNKNFRRQILFWGAVASMAGWVCWYLLLGPVLY